MEMKRAGGAVLLTCVLAACGQKGPLYLPDRTSEIVTRPTQTPSEPAAAPGSPQSGAPAGESSATEGPAPAATPANTDQADADKKKKGAANSPL